LFEGKTKDTGKGFEVVRSSRAPSIRRRTPSGTLILEEEPSYSDDSGDVTPERRRDLALSDEDDAIDGGTRHLPDEEPVSPSSSEDDDDDRSFCEGE